MYYVTKELLKQLPEDSRKMIEADGITLEDMEAMPAEEKAKLMEDGASDVEAPDTKGDDMGAPVEKGEKPADDSMKLPKSTKFGDEDQYETNLGDDGEMEELPESKKNAIGSFEQANQMGNALIEEMAKPKKKAKKDITQDELES